MVNVLNGEKKIAENFNRLSRVHERFRQTDDRQTTDGRAIAYSERKREFTFAKNTFVDTVRWQSRENKRTNRMQLAELSVFLACFIDSMLARRHLQRPRMSVLRSPYTHHSLAGVSLSNNNNNNNNNNVTCKVRNSQ